MSSSSLHVDRDLDLLNSGRGVWLVKVPKYIANRWDKAPGNIEVGKLKISKFSFIISEEDESGIRETHLANSLNMIFYKLSLKLNIRGNPGQKAQVSLNLSESVLCLREPGEENIPRDHRLDVSLVTRQMLGVFSHYSPNSNTDSVVPESEKLSLEGKVVQKLECRPYADSCYMKLKFESIKKASLPTRQVKQLDRIVHNYKPVSDHKNNIEYDEKKKSEGKKARDDKEVVLEMLFAAFEKHQYYNIKDLVKKTRQPIVYLKEILKEVCNYNLKNPHKNMWELKPEYRHYKETEQADASASTPATSTSD